MENDDGSLVAMFKEISVIQGKRTLDGAWIASIPWYALSALEVAIRLTDQAKKGLSHDHEGETAFSTPGNV